MWNRNITGLDAEGTFRSLNGAADENVFIGKASKAGFFCFFKVWRDMPYDAVLDYEHVLYRVEVKGSSSGTYNLTRGGRSGAQIDRHAENRTRRIERSDCDFVVCVDSNNGDCYILPVDILDITNRKILAQERSNLLRKNGSCLFMMMLLALLDLKREMDFCRCRCQRFNLLLRALGQLCRLEISGFRVQQDSE